MLLLLLLLLIVILIVILILIVWIIDGVLFGIIMMGRAVKLAKFVAKLKGKEELLRGGR